ncbi:ABC transporter permease [Euzebya tangerina]|uniref:ABC transporter permease n=1 Tax=Euzebya tangerina TaxID=591198 RepID=UPI000E323923|nr:ABC transporter permease [Euzebya tangerina]
MPDETPARAPAVEGERTVLIGTALVVAVILALLAWRVAVGYSGVVSFFEFVAERVDEILTRTREHAVLTVASVGTATIFSVPLGVAIQKTPPLRNGFLTLFGIALTVPSLAFFAILLPVLGIGFGPPYVALAIYSVLPILRNTVTGLDSVDEAVVESAKGMGLSRFERIRKIELPLAWPVILTGIRVATILAVSIAAIATLIGAGGLGELIQDGLTRFGFPNSTEAIWAGTLFTIVLALVFEAFFALLTKLTTSKGIQ